MSNFKIGQKVVYVGRDKRHHNKTWVIIASKQGCCTMQYDLGLPISSGFLGYQRCTLCGGIFPSNTIWKAEYTIRPLLDTFAEETLSKAKSDADEILEIMETLQPLKENVR